MNIICIGSGNVATHLMQALQSAGHHILEVFSRNPESAHALAALVAAKAVTDLNLISKQADLYVIAVSDDAISEVNEALQGSKGLVVHTSGTTALTVLQGHQQRGVFYPLQTFSKGREVDFKQIPIFVESDDIKVQEQLMQLALSLTTQAYLADSERRKVLHIAAVFACNFSNHLYTLAASVLNHNDLPFEVLKPLIQETAAKIQQQSPYEAQTGPAVRRDEKTMQAHLQWLKDQPHLAEIYHILSDSIKITHK